MQWVGRGVAGKKTTMVVVRECPCEGVFFVEKIQKEIQLKVIYGVIFLFRRRSSCSLAPSRSILSLQSIG